MRRYSRRTFLGVAAGGLAVGGGGAFLAAPRGAESPARHGPTAAAAPDALRALPTFPEDVEPNPVPQPPPPPRSRGREDVVLMAGTEWEAHGTIHHSGLLGPRVMVLGGVHGNEPGGWLGAESVANWEVRRGSLIVLPRVNWRSANAFERTLDGFGDLNRLYPGHPEGLPMARMAAEIVALAASWRPAWLWDMHESWGFYSERGDNSGTAFIGQTVTTTSTTAELLIDDIIARVNGEVAERERFLTRMRPGGYFRNDGFSPWPDRDDDDEDPEEERREEAMRTLPDRTRGSSSLGMGRFVEGVNPVLVEMGQANQTEARRSQLHQRLLRELLTDLRMV